MGGRQDAERERERGCGSSGAALSPGCIMWGEAEGGRAGGPTTRSLASPSALGRGLVFIPAATENKETLVFTTLTLRVLTVL